MSQIVKIGIIVANHLEIERSSQIVSSVNVVLLRTSVKTLLNPRGLWALICKAAKFVIRLLVAQKEHEVE